MTDDENAKKSSREATNEAGSCSIVYIKKGDLCPNCSFAKLKREPGKVIKCPVCGWGTFDKCT